MKLIKIIILLLLTLSVQSQTCEELIDYVKAQSYPSTYYSPNSEAISKVSFYSIYENYETYYFAIVCFKSKYSYSCNEYIYQVGSMTSYYYSTNYHNSAGKAFWDYIEPYSNTLGCSP